MSVSSSAVSELFSLSFLVLSADYNAALPLPSDNPQIVNLPPILTKSVTSGLTKSVNALLVTHPCIS